MTFKEGDYISNGLGIMRVDSLFSFGPMLKEKPAYFGPVYCIEDGTTEDDTLCAINEPEIRPASTLDIMTAKLAGL